MVVFCKICALFNESHAKNEKFNQENLIGFRLLNQQSKYQNAMSYSYSDSQLQMIHVIEFFFKKMIKVKVHS